MTTTPPLATNFFSKPKKPRSHPFIIDGIRLLQHYADCVSQCSDQIQELETQHQSAGAPISAEVDHAIAVLTGEKAAYVALFQGLREAAEKAGVKLTFTPKSKSKSAP